VGHFPRLIYRLEERFVLFPFERGSKRGRLVLRARGLAAVARTWVAGNKPFVMSAPAVLGEITQARKLPTSEVPIIVEGAFLHELNRYGSVDWCFRHCRAAFLVNVALRFEVGSRHVYATHTAYYERSFLLALAEGEVGAFNPRSNIR
jgi:hypothetical protein